MSDSHFAPGQAVIVLNNMSAADNLTEKTTLSQGGTAFGSKDSSGLNGREAIVTTDGGNDTEPEETEEDAVSQDTPGLLCSYKLMNPNLGLGREAKKSR